MNWFKKILARLVTGNTVLDALAQAETAQEIVRTRALERAVPYILALILRDLQNGKITLARFPWLKLILQAVESLQIFAFAIEKLKANQSLDPNALDTLERYAHGLPARDNYKTRIEPLLPALPDFATEEKYAK